MVSPWLHGWEEKLKQMDIYPLVNIQQAIETMAIEIVSFPIDSMVIFHSYVSLPEGICRKIHGN